MTIRNPEFPEHSWVELKISEIERIEFPARAVRESRWPHLAVKCGTAMASLSVMAYVFFAIYHTLGATWGGAAATLPQHLTLVAAAFLAIGMVLVATGVVTARARSRSSSRVTGLVIEPGRPVSNGRANGEMVGKT